MLEELAMFWWGWACLAAILIILEIILPVFFFLGFAVGAAFIAILLLIGGPMLFLSSIWIMLLVFAFLSLMATLGCWRFFKPKIGGSVKIWKEDIND